jgi:hypothetical protein
MINVNSLAARARTLVRQIAEFLKRPGIPDGLQDPDYEEAMEYLNRPGDASMIQEYLLKKAVEKKRSSTA